MPAPDWDDLDAFVDDFAVPVVIIASGVTRTVRGIFDDHYLDTTVGEYAMDSSEPRVTAKESDLLGVERGDRARVHGIAYDVMDAPKQDGTGMAVLRLAKAL